MPKPSRIEADLMRGAGPTAVLKLLESGERYGYELVEELTLQTGGVLAMGQSTLYPLLYNLEAKGLISASWRTAESGRERRYYALTARGKRRLAASLTQWRALADALGRLGILDPASPSAFGQTRAEVPAC